MVDRDLTDHPDYQWTPAKEKALQEAHNARADERMRIAIEGPDHKLHKARAQARYRSMGKSYTGKPHARTTNCPACAEPLIVVKLSETTARKGCPNCKRKFDYTRTDTKQGRAKRTKEWRDKKNADGIPKAE